MKKLKVRIGLFIIVMVFLIGSLPVASAKNTSFDANPTILTPTATVSSATPFIMIDPIRNHTNGELFFINGTTNLPITEKLTMHIYNLNFYCCAMLEQMKTGSCPSISSNNFAQIFNISISSDRSGTNQWSVNVTDTAKNFLSDKNIVVICSDLVCNPVDTITDTCKARESVGSNTTNDFFTLFPVTNTPPATVPQTILSSTTPIQPPSSQTIVPPTTQSSPLPSEWPIVGIAAIAILKHIHGKKSD